MNILKNSIFSRFGDDENEIYEGGLVGGILCVLGSTDRGKSIVHEKLQNHSIFCRP